MKRAPAAHRARSARRAWRPQLPPRMELWQVFATCALVVHAWSFYNLFHEAPALILRLDAWGMIGVAAYVQAFALLESAIVSLLLFALAALLPGAWYRAHFVTQSAAIVLVSTAWAVAGHYNGLALLDWTGGQWALWALAYLASVLAAGFAVRRLPRVERGVQSFVERLVVLAALYVAVGCLGAILVLLRNLGVQ